MSVVADALTKEDKDLLDSLEEIFKDRYTEKDESFKATMERKTPTPPIVENWVRYYDDRHNRPRYPFDRGSYSHGRPRSTHENYENYRGYRHEDDYETESHRNRYYSAPSRRRHEHHRYEPY